jgi:hypothetical protein
MTRDLLSETSNSDALATVIAGLMERDDLTIRGPERDHLGYAWLELQFDDGLCFHVMVREVKDGRGR